VLLRCRRGSSISVLTSLVISFGCASESLGIFMFGGRKCGAGDKFCHPDISFGYLTKNGPEAEVEEISLVKSINPPKPRMKTLVFSMILIIVDVSSASYLQRAPTFYLVIIN
jgi:hypothetical protein